MTPDIVYRHEPPPAAEYHALFESTGWNAAYGLDAPALAAANAASWFVVAAYAQGRLVGFGRVVSDGVFHAMIYDMIVAPDAQARGIGSAILQRLATRCREAGIRDVQLFCARGKRGFYERNGFAARPEDGPGMQLAGP